MDKITLKLPIIVTLLLLGISFSYASNFETKGKTKESDKLMLSSGISYMLPYNKNADSQMIIDLNSNLKIFESYYFGLGISYFSTLSKYEVENRNDLEDLITTIGNSQIYRNQNFNVYGDLSQMWPLSKTSQKATLNAGYVFSLGMGLDYKFISFRENNSFYYYDYEYTTFDENEVIYNEKNALNNSIDIILKPFQKLSLINEFSNYSYTNLANTTNSIYKYSFISEYLISSGLKVFGKYTTRKDYLINNSLYDDPPTSTSIGVNYVF